VISLIGLCVLFMGLLYWLVKPLELLLTPFLELQNLGVLALLLLVWVFATSTEKGSGT